MFKMHIDFLIRTNYSEGTTSTKSSGKTPMIPHPWKLTRRDVALSHD